MKFFLLFMLLMLSACATKGPPARFMTSVSKVFYVDYQKTWRAAMLVLEDYTIEEENNERGILKTGWIPIGSIWKPPFPVKDIEGKYKLKIRMIKGQSLEDEPVMTKVHVLKTIMTQRGFIAEPERIPSTGLEEKTILYRILREIKIERGISSHHKKTAS